MDKWPDILSGIGSILSGITAIFSLLAFLFALKMQRQDSINDVRPELVLLGWGIEDDGHFTTVRPGLIKNVGNGPAFDISFATLSEGEVVKLFYTSVFICPFLPPGEQDGIEGGIGVDWSKPSLVPVIAETRGFFIHLFYRDMNRRNYFVKMYFVVAKHMNFKFGGAKQVVPRVFFVRREPAIIRTLDGYSYGIKSRIIRWWKKQTQDLVQTPRFEDETKNS